MTINAALQVRVTLNDIVTRPISVSQSERICLFGSTADGDSALAVIPAF